MTGKRSISVDEEDAGMRLDRYLADEIQEYSRTFFQKLIKSGAVMVNGLSAKPKDIVSAGDVIDLEIPQIKEPEIVAQNIPLDILYEDDDIIVVNKPKGMVVHPAPGHTDGTLVNALLYHCHGNLSGINGVARPGIVHRIDKDTTGVLVAAKNDEAHRFLASQLAVHSITREYEAIVCNAFSELSGTVDKPLGRDPKDRKKFAVVPDGRRAVTHYTVISNLGRYAHISCHLETGRTHQIRVHMASIGHPLLGDPLYGPNKCPFNLDGQCLHARLLGFIHPRTKQYMEFEAPLPGYFQKLLSVLGERMD
ncbi:MAG: RluA family pseudouridine synthase [Lachnospiraceae bacterium]|jgi:23S rRNA pseudouridine1911/1915/1917 synthase